MAKHHKHDIAGMDFDVYSDRTSVEFDNDPDTAGLCDFNRRKIYIDKDLPTEEKERVWLHEAFEAMRMLFGWKLTEDQMVEMEQGTHYTLKNAGMKFPNFD